MSVSGKEIAGAGDNAVRNSDDEDDRFDKRRRKKKRSYLGFAGKFARAKQLWLSSSFPRNSKRRPIWSGDEGLRGDQRCLFCLGRPKALKSPVESRSSDPDDLTFTHEMVRDLLEKNDFYSKECNPHLDVDDLASCSALANYSEHEQISCDSRFF